MNSMRICLAMLAAGLGSVTALRATDWTTTDGKTYEDVKLVRLDADSVTIMYSSGGARIPLEKLPANLQQRFGYDPEAAKTAAAARAKEAVENAKALQAEMDEASAIHQAGAEPAAATNETIAPTPVFDTGTHHSMDDAAQAAVAMRRDLSDPTYHTMAHMFYTVQTTGLGPDTTDPKHHTMDEAVRAVDGQK